MPYLIEILLPVTERFEQHILQGIRSELNRSW